MSDIDQDISSRRMRYLLDCVSRIFLKYFFIQLNSNINRHTLN